MIRRPTSCSSVFVQAALSAVLYTHLQGGQVQFPEPMAEPSPFVLWDSTLTLRTSGGYNSNPSLAFQSEARHPAAFFEYGGDLLFFRLPTDGDTASIFLSGDDRRYFSNEDVPGQQNFLSQFSYEHESPSWWNAGGNLIWMYANQVVDLSELGAYPKGPEQVQGNTVIFRPNFSGRIGTNWLAGIELPLTYQGLSVAPDGFLEAGPQLLLTRRLRNGSTASIGYSWSERVYSTATPLLTPGGEVINPVTLVVEHLQLNTVNGKWQQYWDREKQWRTTLSSGFTTARDNGTGYYNYNRFRVGAGIQANLGRWILSLDGAASWYQYTEQTSAPEESTLRDRQEYSVGLQASYEITDHVRSFVRFSWETSIANTPQDNYGATTSAAGFEFEF
ncbi:MAG: outer membrane beta-barrel protein [Verrucomicrobiota bacterium]